MSKPFLLLKIILILCLLSLSSASFAEQNHAKRADEIFTILENGTSESPDAYQRHLSQLENLIKKTDTSRQLRFLRAQCWSFDPYLEGETPKALSFVKHALAHPEIEGFAEHKLDLELCQTWFNEKNGDVDTALIDYGRLINEGYALENLRLIADAQSMRGYVHSYQGNFIQALEDLLSAHALYQSLHLPAYAHSSLYEIATSYRRIGDYSNAIRYFEQLKANHISNNNLDGANAISVSIAIAEEERGELERAKILFEEGHSYWQQQQRPLEQATVAVNIAGTLIKLGQLDQALQYLKEAEPFILPTDEAFYSFMHLFRAQIYLANEQLSAANNSLSYARSAFKRVNNLRGLTQLQLVQSQVFLKQRNWRQAYYALDEYMTLHSELDAKQLSNYSVEMRTRFNAEQIEEENRHLIENQRLKEIELAMLEQNKLQQGIIIFLGGFIIIIISLFAYKQNQKNKLLSSLALTDDLTQLPNRRYIYHKAQNYFQEALKARQALSVITFDVDYFKLINDQYGHEVGDDALILLADICRETLKPEYKIARVGGEEFLIILANTDMAQAYKLAQSLVLSVSERDFSNFPQGFSLTISAGVASLSAKDTQLPQLLKRADDALYTAKNEGRNQARMS